MSGTLDTDAEGEGDSYLASLSDLMVGMLFIFIIMLMAFALSYRSAESAHQQSVSDLAAQVAEYELRVAELERTSRAYQTKADVLSRGQALLSQNQALRDRMLRTIKQELERRGVRVTVEESGVLRLRDGLPFASGDAELRGLAQANAGILAQVLAAVLPCYTASGPEVQRQACPEEARPVIDGIYVEGHTDNIPIVGRYRDNWALSTTRASNTYEALKQARPDLIRLRNGEGRTVFGVSGYGEERPVAANDNEQGRALNRRIDLRFLLSTPTPEELERIRQEAEHVR